MTKADREKDLSGGAIAAVREMVLMYYSRYKLQNTNSNIICKSSNSTNNTTCNSNISIIIIVFNSSIIVIGNNKNKI